MDRLERSFNATAFTKNRQRLTAHGAGRALFDKVAWAAGQKRLLSDAHSALTGP